jgi:dTDP-L-rhamnose 4-epimerase
MTNKRILVTGGAGFVGSHTADALLGLGHEVRVFDNISPQVHPHGRPAYLSRDVEFVLGDIRNQRAVTAALDGVDAVYHLAAMVGVGQSMYEIVDYTATNILGTANLLQAILDQGSKIEKLIVASSMSIYGEGRYSCGSCGPAAPRMRALNQLKQSRWELTCATCGSLLEPLPTDETKPLECSSIYALSKKAQEEMALVFGATYSIPTVALRYFNIYGPRQALSNPYTGVAAIFASRLMNGNPPVIFEDGRQMRDFVNIRDIVQANLLALESSAADGMALNVGSGSPVSVLQVATGIAEMLGVKIPFNVSGRYRAGDIRHCFAEIRQAAEILGYTPSVSFHDGTSELVEWLKSQQAHDRTEEALGQLSAHGLVA